MSEVDDLKAKLASMERKLEEAKTTERTIRMDLAQARFDLSRAPKGFRCFHCDEVFESFDAAKFHFGRNSTDTPKCVESNTLLAKMRSQVVQIASERDEARSQLNALEEQLLSVLPEDFGAVEYIKSLESQLRASQERELALRSVLDEVQDYRGACHCAMDDEYVVGRIAEALSATSTAAQQVRAEIEREALEKAWERAGSAPDPFTPNFFACNFIDMNRWEALRTAIIGEKEKS